VKEQKIVNVRRQRRRNHVRQKVRGTADRPRLSVHRSLKHLHCQLIDDVTGRTIASASTLEKSVQEQLSYGGNKSAAEVIGRVIAERARAAGITQARFDRGHCKYHGRVAALADAARGAGIVF
jgi:large subunit ribosomal protein L18